LAGDTEETETLAEGNMLEPLLEPLPETVTCRVADWPTVTEPNCRVPGDGLSVIDGGGVQVG
jgi:hypothetical protein